MSYTAAFTSTSAMMYWMQTIGSQMLPANPGRQSVTMISVLS
jgi:hypothetical protein